jgi:hypothetical protein
MLGWRYSQWAFTGSIMEPESSWTVTSCSKQVQTLGRSVTAVPRRRTANSVLRPSHWLVDHKHFDYRFCQKVTGLFVPSVNTLRLGHKTNQPTLRKEMSTACFTVNTKHTNAHWAQDVELLLNLVVHTASTGLWTCGHTWQHSVGWSTTPCHYVPLYHSAVVLHSGVAAIRVQTARRKWCD